MLRDPAKLAVRQALLAFSLPPSGKLCFACLTASFAGSLNIRVLRDPGNKKKGRQKAQAHKKGKSFAWRHETSGRHVLKKKAKTFRKKKQSLPSFFLCSTKIKRPGVLIKKRSLRGRAALPFSFLPSGCFVSPSKA
jgi:hypothetical protein